MCKEKRPVEKRAFEAGYELAKKHYGSKLQVAVEECARLDYEHRRSERDWPVFVHQQCEGYHLKIQDQEDQIQAFKLGPSHWLDGSSLRTASCQQTETYFEGNTACAYHLQRAFFAKYPNVYLYIMHCFF